MLNGFDEEIFFFVGGVVGVLDVDFEIGVDGIGEDMIESVEMIFIGSGNYFGDVKYERIFGVVVMDIDGSFVISGIFVKSFDMVFLGSDGGRKVKNYYF